MSTSSRRSIEAPRPRPLRIFIATAAGTVVGLVGLTRLSTTEAPARATHPVPEAAAADHSAAPEDALADLSREAEEPATPRDETSSNAEAPLSEELQASMTRLASALALLTDGGTAGARTTAIREWKSGLQGLGALGSQGIPAILRFLAEGTDLHFGPELRAELGHTSARTGLMQVLRGIGGPEAVAAMGQLLEQTRSYQELAVMAQGLEEADPGMHRDRIRERARAELAAASAAPIDASAEPTDAAALFEVLGHYGGAESAQDLEAAAERWKYYATSALARLPEGAGVPSLIRLADPNLPGSQRLQALQVLAELAPANEAARDYLITQTSSGGIHPEHWSYLRQPLSGNQYFVADAVLTEYPPVNDWTDIQTVHIRSGNQTLHSIPSASSQTTDGVQRHLALIDQLLGFAPGGAAQTSLREARQVLEGRMQRATVSAPAFTTENP